MRIKLAILTVLAVALMNLSSTAQGISSDNALGLHPDGGGWGFYPAGSPDSKLPYVLLVGDSVMKGYRAEVVKILAGKANVDAWATGQNLASPDLLPDLVKVLKSNRYDVVHFNIGLHDWPEGRIPAGQYEPLMERYVLTYVSNAPAAKLIWASSTPVTVKNGATLDPKINPIILRQNEIAAGVVQARTIGVDDLYTLGANHLSLMRGDQFHWTATGTYLMAEQVAGRILSALNLSGVAGVVPVVKTLDNTTEFHIAPNGNDANEGTVQQPFLTLQRARDAVRSARAKGEPVSVILHGGIYRLERTLEFSAADSGTAAAPVIWKAAPGEAVRIIGGLVVLSEAIKPVTDPAILNRIISARARQDLQEIDLLALGVKDCGQVGPRGFRRPYTSAPLELFIGDRPMSLARWPKADEPASPIGKVLDTGSIPRNGEKPLRGGSFLVKTDRPGNWSNINDIWISGLFHYGYADDTVSLAAITQTNGAFIFTTMQPHLYGFKSGSPWNTWYALNVLEEIDRPGEYAINRNTGKLYFLPPAGTSLPKAGVMVSTLGEPMLALENASYIRFENLTFEVSRGLGVYVERGESCVFSSCVFRNLGTLGVCMGRGITPDPLYRASFTGQPISRQIGSLDEHVYENPDLNREGGHDHRLENCSFYDLGAGGISLGGGDRKTLTPAHNTVYNCLIHDFNRWERSYRSGINIDGVGNRIEHCLIYNAPGSAIYLHGNDHFIANNEIHHVMMTGDDMGAFYMGRDPSERGNIICSNYWHDLAPARSTFCLYFDDAGGDDSKVYGNIFRRAGNVATVFINNGSDFTVENNIFISCNAAIRMGSGGGWRTKEGRFERLLNAIHYNQPPWSERYPEFKDYLEARAQMPRRDIFAGNLAVDCKSATTIQMELHNNWITTEDPGFVDMAKGDYRLKPDAEAFEKIPGFKPGDLSQMGLLKSSGGPR